MTLPVISRGSLLFAFLRARQSGTRSGKAIGRPKRAGYDVDAMESALRNGRSVREVAKEPGASVGTAKGLLLGSQGVTSSEAHSGAARGPTHEKSKGGANAETLSPNLA
jgi:hypothetical protein